MNNKETINVVTMLTLYSFFGSIAAIYYYAGGLSGANIWIVITITLSSFLYSKSWFECISGRRMQNNERPYHQVFLTLFLYIICAAKNENGILVTTVCLMRAVTLFSTSYKLCNSQKNMVRTGRRYSLMPPLMFVILQSIATTAALCLAVTDDSSSLVCEALPFSYAILWIATLDKPRDKVVRVNTIYALSITALLATFFILFVSNPNFGATRNAIRPYFNAAGLVFTFSIIYAIPGLLELIKIYLGRTDLGQKLVPVDQRNQNYRDQLYIVRVVEMIIVGIVACSWVYSKYSVYYMLYYFVSSTCYVIVFRYHFVKLKGKPYCGSILLSIIWTSLPCILVITESIGFLPTIVKIGTWSSLTLGILIDVFCAGMAMYKYKSANELLSAFKDMGLFGTHILGIGIFSLIVMISPNIDDSNSIVLFVMLISAVILFVSYLTIGDDSKITET